MTSETPPLSNINHVTNICTDMEQTKEFYDAADEQGKMERRRQHFALDYGTG